MKYLFEDNLDCFPYQLLPDFYRDRVFGAKGNNNLIKLCRYAEYADAIVLVDVNADNSQTISVYNKLCKEAEDRPGQYVVPIPCIEYYFIKAFFDKKNELVLTLLEFQNYKRYIIEKDGFLYDTRNYENFAKSLIMSSKHCYADSTFVSSDCLCGNVQRECTELSLQHKVLTFLRMLPVVISVKYTDADLRAIIQRQRDLYYKQANSFLTLGIIPNLK